MTYNADITLIKREELSTPALQGPSNHGIILSTTSSQNYTWTLLNDAGLNLNTSTNIDHTDHKNGVAKLLLKTVVSGSKEDTQYKPEDLSEHTPDFINFSHKAVYGAKAHNIGMMFYNKKSGYLKRASLGNFKGNLTAGYARLFLYGFDYSKSDGKHLQLLERGIASDGKGNRAKSYVGEGNTITHRHNQATSDYSRIHSRFSGTVYLEKGWYFIFVLMDPDPNETISYTWRPRRKTYSAPWIAIPHGSHPLQDRTYNTLVESPCPYHGVDVIHISGSDYSRGNNESARYSTYPPYNMYTILETTNSGPMDIVLDVSSSSDAIVPGCLLSQVIQEDFDIASVEIEANVVTPSGATHEIFVSNDNGAHFFKVSGNTHTFGTTGSDFIWKICMNPNPDGESPKLQFNQDKGWAVKVKLNSPADEQEMIDDGCVVSNPYNGNVMLQEVLQNTLDDQFSHWEFARIWASGPKNDVEEALTGQTIRINIENSEDGTIWNKIISDVQLGQFMHDSVDYANYTGAYESDEFNFRLHLDTNLRDQTYLIDPMTTAWTSAQLEQVDVAATDDGYTIQRDPEGVKSDPEAYETRDINTFTFDGAAEGALAYKEINKDLSDYHYLTMHIKVDSDIAQRDLKLLLSADANGDEIYEEHNLPTIRDEWGYVHVVIKLRNPILLQNVEYLVLSARDTMEDGIVSIGKIEGTTTEVYPLYGPYIRIRACMTGDGTTSPSIRKIGFVPITK